MRDIREFGAYPTNSSAVNKTAIQAAINSGSALLIPRLDTAFPCDTGLTLTNNTRIVGEGFGSILSTTGSGPLFIANGVSGWSLEGFAAQGSATVTKPNDYPVVSGPSGQSFIQTTNVDRFRVSNLDLSYFAGWTIDFQATSWLGSGVAKGIFRDISFRNCFAAVVESNSGEYATFENMMVDSCTYGLYSSSGNCRHTGCQVTNCQIGIHIDGNGTNCSHGAFVNCSSNHNETNLRANDSVSTGEGFAECDFLGSVHPTSNFGQILIINSRGIRLTGGSIASAIVIQDGTGTYSGMNTIQGALFRTDIASFPTPNYPVGKLAIKNCIEPGGMSSFNN